MNPRIPRSPGMMPLLGRTWLGLAQTAFQVFGRCDVYESNDRALNDVGQCAVGHDAHVEPVPVRGWNLLLAERQRAQGLLGILVQLRVDQGAGEIAQGPADVPVAQLHDPFHVLGKTSHVERVVQE